MMLGAKFRGMRITDLKEQDSQFPQPFAADTSQGLHASSYPHVIHASTFSQVEKFDEFMAFLSPISTAFLQASFCVLLRHGLTLTTYERPLSCPCEFMAILPDLACC
jgi:hypothetical protein